MNKQNLKLLLQHEENNFGTFCNDYIVKGVDSIFYNMATVYKCLTDLQECFHDNKNNHEISHNIYLSLLLNLNQILINLLGVNEKQATLIISEVVGYDNDSYWGEVLSWALYYYDAILKFNELENKNE